MTIESGCLKQISRCQHFRRKAIFFTVMLTIPCMLIGSFIFIYPFYLFIQIMHISNTLHNLHVSDVLDYWNKYNLKKKIFQPTRPPSCSSFRRSSTRWPSQSRCGLWSLFDHLSSLTETERPSLLLIVLVIKVSLPRYQAILSIVF